MVHRQNLGWYRNTNPGLFLMAINIFILACYERDNISRISPGVLPLILQALKLR
jgi:hypothetical protein